MTLARHFFFLILATALGAPQIAHSESGGAPKSLGTFGNWKTFTYGGEHPVCYMTLATHFNSPKMKRNETYLMITHRPGENVKDVVSYIAGYSFKPVTDVTVTAGKKSFDLFTQKDTAWSRDAATDHAIVSAIRNNAKIKIAGSPSMKGIASVADTIELKGADAAYRAIGKACGYPEEKKPAPVKKASVKKEKPPANKPTAKKKH